MGENGRSKTYKMLLLFHLNDISEKFIVAENECGMEHQFVATSDLYTRSPNKSKSGRLRVR